MRRHPGDSAEQRKTGEWLRERASEELGVPLREHRISLERGWYLELDGFCESPPILCEIWAHVGRPKSAQKNKVMKDALKLLFARKRLKSG